jgi:drug/metabolite transporter (DMT)-like permease
VTAALLAIGASVGYGVSDFYAGVLARRLPTVLIALWSQVVGLVALGIAAMVSGQTFATEGFAWGVGGGVVAAIALLLFYRALEIGPASVAAPVTAAGTLVPVAASIISGDAPSLLALAGVPLTVVGLALVARGNAEDDLPETQPCVGPGVVVGRQGARPRAAADAVARGDGDAGPPARAGRGIIALSLAAAAGFGTFFLLLDAGTAAAPGAELWAIVGVLVGALPTTIVAAVRARESLHLSRLLIPIAVVAVFDLAGDASLTFAVAEGDLATVGVLASLDPLVTVLLAMVLLHERLPRWQAGGVVLCLSGIVLVAAG